MNCLDQYRSKLLAPVNRDFRTIVAAPDEESIHRFRVGAKRLTALYRFVCLSSSFPLQVNDELKLSLRQSGYSAQLGLTGYTKLTLLDITLMERLRHLDTRSILLKAELNCLQILKPHAP
jgi:CHAD domain-containing protein